MSEPAGERAGAAERRDGGAARPPLARSAVPARRARRYFLYLNAVPLTRARREKMTVARIRKIVSTTSERRVALTWEEEDLVEMFENLAREIARRVLDADELERSRVEVAVENPSAYGSVSVRATILISRVDQREEMIEMPKIASLVEVAAPELEP